MDRSGGHSIHVCSHRRAVQPRSEVTGGLGGEFVKTKTMTLANPISREPRDRIQLARPGKFTHRKWGEFTLDRDVFESFIDNFHLMPMSKPEIPIDYNHEFAKAGGWIKGLEIGEDGHLYASNVEWTPQAVDEIKTGQYKYLSMAFSGKGVDSKGVEIGPALIAVSLTNIPLLKGMEPVSVELEEGQEEASQIYEFEVDLGEVAQFQAVSPSDRSNFAHIDEKGIGYLPMDSQTIEKSMAALDEIELDEETKKKAARKLAGRARRLNCVVSSEFAKKWDLDLAAPKPPVTVSATTSTSGSGVVNVILNISDPSETNEGDKTPQTTSETTPADEGEAMMEGK